MQNSVHHIEKLGQFAIREGFITPAHYQEAIQIFQRKPHLSFITILKSLGYLNAEGQQALEAFQLLDQFSAPSPSATVLKPEQQNAMMLTPLEDSNSETPVLQASDLASPRILLPEPASLPSIEQLLKNLPNIPVEDKFHFAHPEDEMFAKYTIKEKLLSRETIEVLLEMQRNLRKMQVGFPLAQLVRELNYLEEDIIENIQRQQNASITQIQKYSLNRLENEALPTQLSKMFSAQILTEGKKVKEYFERLGIDKTLAEVLLIQGHYQRGSYQKKGTTSRPSSLTRSSSIAKKIPGLGSLSRSPTKKTPPPKRRF